MRLSPLALEKLKPASIQTKIAAELGVSYSAVSKWYYQDNDKFAHLRVIKAIEKITGLKQKQIFENESNN